MTLMRARHPPHCLDRAILPHVAAPSAFLHLTYGAVTKLVDNRIAGVLGWVSEYLAIGAGGMADTVKMRRPDFRRQQNAPTGRVEHDSRGTAVWKRTRATDSIEPPDSSELALVDEPRSRKSGLNKKQTTHSAPRSANKPR